MGETPRTSKSKATITCRKCGCLNFSSGEICDTCVQQQQQSHPNGVNRSSSSSSLASHPPPTNAVTSESNRKRSPVVLTARKSAPKRPKSSPTPSPKATPSSTTNKQVVIDLISSDDDEEESTIKDVMASRLEKQSSPNVPRLPNGTLRPPKSRIFASVPFDAMDFPTMVATGAKKASQHHTPASTVAPVWSNILPCPTSSLTSSQSSITQPAPSTTPTQPPPAPEPNDVHPQSGSTEDHAIELSDDDESSESPNFSGRFMSRKFDQIEFEPRDFATIQDGLQIARKSSHVRLEVAVSATAQQAKATQPKPPPPPSEPAKEATIAQEPTRVLDLGREKTDSVTLLEPRKKTPVLDLSPGPSTQLNDWSESSTKQPRSMISPVKKPPLGYCSVDFLLFMQECCDDGDDDGPSDNENLRLQLLETVDLTHLSDSDSDNESIASLTTREMKPTTEVLIKSEPGRRQQQKETCVLCDEKRSVRVLIHCPECRKYYHKKCAKEYGDDTICWNCELKGMIDDSELTEMEKTNVIGMLSTLRQEDASKEEEENKETEQEQTQEFKQDEVKAPEPDVTKSFDTKATTRSMRRWKMFLEVSTATLEQSFKEVTTRITEELQCGERRKKYSRGFTTKEAFEAEIAQVLDTYADLQGQLDRDAREKAKADAAATATAPPVADVNSSCSSHVAGSPTIVQ